MVTRPATNRQVQYAIQVAEGKVVLAQGYLQEDEEELSLYKLPLIINRNILAIHFNCDKLFLSSNFRGSFFINTLSIRGEFPY